MAWIWRICGGVVGGLIATLYAFVAAPAISSLAIWTHSMGLGADVAQLALSLYELVAVMTAAYMILVALSYLLAVLLAAFNSSAPSPVLPFIYLLVAGAIAVLAGVRIGFAVAALPVEAITVILCLFLFMLGHALLVVIGYVFAATFAGPSGSDSGGESLWRGYLIGVNSAMNVISSAVVYTVLLQPFLTTQAPVVGLAIALALGLATLSASFASTSLIFLLPAGLATVIQTLIEAFLGWLTWLMPMSWIVTGLGFVFFYLTWLGHCLITVIPGGLSVLKYLTPADYPVLRVMVNWPTGTILIDNGVIGTSALVATDNGPDLVKARGAFNMGCFVFCNGLGNTETHEHETGHGLSLAAFGGLFHYIGGVDENVVRKDDMYDAYAERVAQSNVVTPSVNGTTGVIDPTVPVWR